MADNNEDSKKMNQGNGGQNEDAVTATPGSQAGNRNDDKGRDPKRISEPGQGGQGGQSSPSTQRPGQEEPRRGSPGREDEDPAKRQTPKSNF